MESNFYEEKADDLHNVSSYQHCLVTYSSQGLGLFTGFHTHTWAQWIWLMAEIGMSFTLEFQVCVQISTVGACIALLHLASWFCYKGNSFPNKLKLEVYGMIMQKSLIWSWYHQFVSAIDCAFLITFLCGFDAFILHGPVEAHWVWHKTSIIGFFLRIPPHHAATTNAPKKKKNL